MYYILYYMKCLHLQKAFSPRHPCYYHTSTSLHRYVGYHDSGLHISQVLRHLHWSPVHQRITFKLAVLVYKSLHGLAPQYLVEDCELVAAADRRQLRSLDIATFVVPRTYTRFGGNRAFPVAGPRLWISLPSNLRQSEFRRALKTYLSS